jgi:hypothetical protein
MKQCLLSVIQPEGNPSSPQVLDGIMRDVDALNQELKAAGAWRVQLPAPDRAGGGCRVRRRAPRARAGAHRSRG